MDAKELRIGNFVNKSLKSGQGRTLVDKIGCQDLVRIVESIGSFNYSAIPLTEEWLMKFGFTKRDEWGWYETNYFTECQEVEEKMLIIYNFKTGRFAISDSDEDESYPVYTSKPISKVHQLQNIFHALTGSDLTIKDVNQVANH